ncbi:hypothetical protein [Gordonia terrae]
MFSRRPVQLYALGMVLANVIGALIVFGLIRFILPLPVDYGDVLSLRNFATFAAYLPFAVVIGFGMGVRAASPAFGWLLRGGVPELEYRTILRLPARQVVINASLWIVGQLVFVSVNGLAGGGRDLLVVISLAVGLGGAATCAMGCRRTHPATDHRRGHDPRSSWSVHRAWCDGSVARDVGVVDRRPPPWSGTHCAG